MRACGPSLPGRMRRYCEKCHGFTCVYKKTSFHEWIEAGNIKGTLMDENLKQIMEERAAIYGLLVRLLSREVDGELLTELRSLPAEDTVDSVSKQESESPFEAGIQLVTAYVQTSDDEALLKLAADFARLFVVREARQAQAAHPFESVYTSAEGGVMGDARDAVVTCYRSEGLDKSASWNLPEDHAALEFEFEQTLCIRTVAALNANNNGEVSRLMRVQHAFLKDHLARWIPLLARAMKADAHTDFYRGLALMMEGFVHDDLIFLEGVIEN